ncbi:MAG: integral rane sensor signal transduction histidine kinase [Ilumatobacteraceae bacterium]|nr:integral rane sensor signal transduction histidine kinase [Ilumatobacteraceae bacterium]MCU1387944.1 integral rane sensor signal transduction histidine kinase [Ilumatobacteraceae bacterium]
MRLPQHARYGAPMSHGRSRRPRVSDQCLAFVLTTPSLVFPWAALIVAVLTFASTHPSLGIIALLMVALVPWALVSGGIDVPPLAVIVVSAVPTLLLILRYNDQAALFLGVVACTWASSRGLRLATWTALILFSAVSVVCNITNHWDQGGWVIWTTGMLFGVFAGSLLHRQRVLTDQLEDARHELDIAAVEHERKAIAREVHDIVGHSLTVVLLNISGARRNLANNPVAAAEALERAECVSRDSLETVRSVVSLLSSADESQRDAPLPGGADVMPLLDQARRSGMPIEVVLAGDPSILEPSIGLTLVRLLQESLANASRHAPMAPVGIDLAIDHRSVTLVVCNEISPTTRSASDRIGIGVAGMHDRVAAIGGSVSTGAESGRWVVRATLPRPLNRAEMSAPGSTTDRSPA